jgi:hypothetical protein
LHEAVNLPLKEREFFSENDVLEQRRDITRQTNLELSRNFITPFDREDIYSLVLQLIMLLEIFMVQQVECVCTK